MLVFEILGMDALLPKEVYEFSDIIYLYEPIDSLALLCLNFRLLLPLRKLSLDFFRCDEFDENYLLM